MDCDQAFLDVEGNDYDENKDHLLMTPKQPDLNFKTFDSDAKFQTMKRQISPNGQAIDDLHSTINLRGVDTKTINHITDSKSPTISLKQTISKKLRSQSNHQNVAEIPCSKSQMDLLARRESPKVKVSKENNRYFANNSRIKEKSKSKQTALEYQENSEHQKARSQKNVFLGLLKAKIMGRSPTPQSKVVLMPPKEIMVGKQSPITKTELKHQLIMHLQNSDKHLFQTQSRTENNVKKPKSQIKSIDPIGNVESDTKASKKVHIDINRCQRSPLNLKDNFAIKPLFVKSQRNEGWTNITAFCPESTEELQKDEPKGKGHPNFLPFDETVFQLLKKYETTDFTTKKRKEQQRTKKRQASKVKLQLNDPLCELSKKQEEPCQNIPKAKLRQRTKSSLVKQVNENSSVLGTNAGFYNRGNQINLEENNLMIEKLDIAKLNAPKTARLINQSFNEYGSITSRHLTAQKPQLFDSMKKYDYHEERAGKASRSPTSKEDAFHNFLKKNNDHNDKKRLLLAHNSPSDRK